MEGSAKGAVVNSYCMVRRSNAIACFRTYPVIFSIRAYVGTSLRANQISMCCNKDVLRMSVHPLFIDLRNIPPDDWRVFSVSVRKHAKPSLGFTYVSSMRGNAARMLPTAQFPYPTPVHALPCLRMSSERKHTHTHTDRHSQRHRDTKSEYWCWRFTKFTRTGSSQKMSVRGKFRDKHRTL